MNMKHNHTPTDVSISVTKSSTLERIESIQKKQHPVPETLVSLKKTIILTAIIQLEKSIHEKKKRGKSENIEQKTDPKIVLYGHEWRKRRIEGKQKDHNNR